TREIGMDRMNLLLVIGEILKTSTSIDGASREEIEYDFNIEPDLMENFLKLLQEKGMINLFKGRFFITDRGREFLNDYEKALDTE
ncbi:MAG: winged helix-turn-helix domain-containing protein, partial [Candidatus Bathyarchaeia archaeon]